MKTQHRVIRTEQPGQVDSNRHPLAPKARGLVGDISNPHEEVVRKNERVPAHGGGKRQT